MCDDDASDDQARVGFKRFWIDVSGGKEYILAAQDASGPPSYVEPGQCQLPTGRYAGDLCLMLGARNSVRNLKNAKPKPLLRLEPKLGLRLILKAKSTSWDNAVEQLRPRLQTVDP